MRLVRRLTVVAFIIVTIVFAFNIYADKKAQDNTYPEFSIENKDDVLQVSVNSTDEDFLTGVTAYDKKDGDLTKQITVESISKFISGHISKITYAVSDSDNHVSRASRKIEFTDYVSPQFTLTRQLCFYVGEDIDITKIIGARDVYDNKENDGDISGKVKLLSSSVSTEKTGEYTVTAQVTNSLGDTSQLQAVVVVRQQNNLEPEIKLKDDIVYIKKGQQFESDKYVEWAKTASGTKINTEKVKVSKTSVNTDKKGCYSVIYKVSDGENEGYAYLTVVVVE